MKTTIRVSPSAILMVILCISSTSPVFALAPLGNESDQAPGRTAAGGPRIPEPQGHFDATQVGPIEPIPRRTLAGRTVSRGKPDLIVDALGFTSEGKVRYFILNLSDTAVSQPFVVDIHFNGQRRDTVKHNSLPPLSQQRVESSLANPGGCEQAQLRALADSQQIVAEANESNNSQVRSQIPPCPDLVVDIDKESVSNGLKYRAKVQVMNIGNRTTGGECFVLLKGGGSGLAFAALNILKRERVGPLLPGQTVSFSEGGEHLGTSTFSYWAVADQLEEIRESNENNNSKGETMGGGH